MTRINMWELLLTSRERGQKRRDAERAAPAELDARIEKLRRDRLRLQDELNTLRGPHRPDEVTGPLPDRGMGMKHHTELTTRSSAVPERTHSPDVWAGAAQRIADPSAQRPLAGDWMQYVQNLDSPVIAHYVGGVLDGKVPNVEVVYGLSNGRSACREPDEGAVVLEGGRGPGLVSTAQESRDCFSEEWK